MKNQVLLLLIFVSIHASIVAQNEELASKRNLQELVISGLKATDKKPLTFTTIDKKRLEQLYYGADIPSLLQNTPSINSYSDNGTGIGYSYFRLRGMDQTRINTTVNGVPINDPENQGVFFNNFADLASSAEQIQVQRGMGTSTNGTSAFGGSINILTRNLSQNQNASLNLGMGSFGSSRTTAEIQTGLLNQHWIFYGRLGQIYTKGFRNNSGSQIQSYQFSLGYVSKKSILKFNFFGGNAQSKLSYLGIDENSFKTNPRSNPFIYGESDAFKQYFNQVQYSFLLANNQSINASAYLVKSEAPKFQFLFPSTWGYGFDFFNMNATPYYIDNNNDTITSPGNVMSSYSLNQTFYGGHVGQFCSSEH
jgi:iron complex outermembrane receptor protein